MSCEQKSFVDLWWEHFKADFGDYFNVGKIATKIGGGASALSALFGSLSGASSIAIVIVDQIAVGAGAAASEFQNQTGKRTPAALGTAIGLFPGLSQTISSSAQSASAQANGRL